MRKRKASLDHVSTTARDRLTEGGLGARVWEAVDAGDTDEAAAVTLMMAFLVTGTDTTILSLAAAVRLFAEHPEQWEALRADPSLVPAAYLEVLRIASPVTVFSRVTIRDWECDNVTIPRGRSCRRHVRLRQPRRAQVGRSNGSTSCTD